MSAAITTLTQWLRNLPIPWLSGRTIGAADMTAQGAVYDAQVTSLKAAVKARMPLEAPADALPYLGQERKLVQGALESDDDFRIRCQYAWEQWELAGTWAELLYQLFFSCGFPSVDTYIVQQNGHAFSLASDPTPTTDPTTILTIQDLGLNYNIADRAGYPWWTFDDRDDLAARFAVILDTGWNSSVFRTAVTSNAVFGFSDTDFYVAGNSGWMVHYNGASHDHLSSFGGAPILRAIWGFSAAEVWVVGSGGSIHKTIDSGATWTPEADPTGGADITGIWGSSALDFWIVERTTGGIWHTADGGSSWALNHTLTHTANAVSLYGTSANDVFVAISTYGYAHWDGASWTEVAYNPTGSRSDMFGIGDQHWIAGAGTTTGGITRVDNAYVTTTVEPTPSETKTVTWIYGTSEGVLYACTSDVGAGAMILRREPDATWSIYHRFPIGGFSPTAMWVAPSGRLWVSGSGGVIYSQPALDAGLVARIVKTWKPAKARYMGAIVVAEGVLWGWPIGTTWGQASLKWGTSVGLRVGP